MGKAPKKHRKPPKSAWTSDTAPRNGGRPKLPYDIVATCRAFTAEAIDKLIHIARVNDGGDPAIMGVQVRAVQTLLDRGWGSAPATLNIAGDLTIKRVVLEDGADAAGD